MTTPEPTPPPSVVPDGLTEAERERLRRLCDDSRQFDEVSAVVRSILSARIAARDAEWERQIEALAAEWERWARDAVRLRAALAQPAAAEQEGER